MATTTLYLSGPMTGLPGYNYAAFNMAAIKLRIRGYRVLNPAETAPHTPNRARSFFMREDLRMLLERADAVAVLDGWGSSNGAKLEIAAALELELPIFLVADLLTGAAKEIKPVIRLEVAA